MKVVCYAQAQHQLEACGRFARGLQRFGIQAAIRSSRDPIDADLAVLWGHRQESIFRSQRRKGGHYLVMERGYIGDRFSWTSLGFDGLNGRAKFPEIDDGLERWNRYFKPALKPWRSSNTNIAVIMGQCRGDASLKGVDFQKWGSEIAKKLQDKKYMPLFRPHPGDANLRIPGVRTLDGSLQSALDQASLVVTYNSNSGVDAVMNGTPAYAEDEGSMIWPIAARHFAPTHRDREGWTRKMAYTQWLPTEIESGDAWAALRTVIRW